MAPHSSTLAWKIPWAEEPGRLHSMEKIKIKKKKKKEMLSTKELRIIGTQNNIHWTQFCVLVTYEGGLLPPSSYFAAINSQRQSLHGV